MPRLTSHASTTVLIALLLSGCDRFSSAPPPMVKITVEYPGARPSVVEDVVCTPIVQQLLGVERLSSITCISRAGRAEIYVQAQRDMDADMFVTLVGNRAKLAAPILPGKAKLSAATNLTGQAMPPVTDVHVVDFPHVDVDREKARRLGLSLTAIFDTLSKEMGSGEPSPDAAKRLEKVTFKSADGKDCRLTDFATIKTVREPSIRVRREPPAGADSK